MIEERTVYLVKSTGELQYFIFNHKTGRRRNFAVYYDYK